MQTIELIIHDGDTEYKISRRAADGCDDLDAFDMFSYMLIPLLKTALYPNWQIEDLEDMLKKYRDDKAPAQEKHTPKAMTHTFKKKVLAQAKRSYAPKGTK
jgi:hypothetical protein